MRFQKGQSGNPSGRPKGWAEIQVLARSMAPEAIEEIRKIAKGDKASAVRLAAWKEILDRGLGKAPQAVKFSGDQENPVQLKFDLDCLSDSEFDALEKIAMKLLAGRPAVAESDAEPQGAGKMPKSTGRNPRRT
jgi:hypothetical protein